jgi:predicted TIM-barrel fold metal-dependent hydrolase
MTSSTHAGTTDRPYIDVHAHIGDTINRVPPVGQTIEKYLGRMAESGVRAALPCPTAGGPLARGVLDSRAQNEAVAAGCKRYPDRFPLGFAIVEVRLQQPGIDEIERAMRDDGLAGFMCHSPISGHQMAEELYPALEMVDGRKGMVLLHVGGRGTEARAAGHAKRFKNTTFIMAHVSMAKDQHAEAVKHLPGLDNAWYDFAQHPASADESWGLAEIVKHFGEDRLVFGSDSPYYDHRLLRDQIEASAGLSDAVKDKIAWRNAVDLIRRFRPQWQFNTTPVNRPAEMAGVDLWEQQTGKPGRLV